MTEQTTKRRINIGPWAIGLREPVWRLSRRYNQIGFGPFVITRVDGKRLDTPIDGADGAL